MIITVASGKGGTGKTTFAVNLAYALTDRGQQVRLLDCDVEEPNAHLFVRPHFRTEDHVTVLKPAWDESKCTGCGACAEACNFNAIAVVRDRTLIFNELCHACGACSFVCPEQALKDTPVSIGKVHYTDEGAPFFFAHGLLNIAETLAPKVVQAVKQHVTPDAINIIDASPGTACPVVKALEAADVAVLVTEPTPFGLHDLKLAAAMSCKMGIPTGIVINRSDGHDHIIANWARDAGIPILGRIPFERKYAESYSAGHVLIEWHPELHDRFLKIYEQVCALKDSTPGPVPSIDPIEISTGQPPTPPPGKAVDSKEIVVISGKGGTGKTSITASFAQLSRRMDPAERTGLVLSDNDVDAADLHLLLSPETHQVVPFVGGVKAAVNPERCIGCGKCADACRFDAFRFDGPANDIVGKTWRIDPTSCEGCGLCERVCPLDAIQSHDAVTGHWYTSTTACGPMAHARLGVAEENSGKLVTQVRNRASELASELQAGRILGDGPPGTGCPVIASVSGADLVLVVTEPTVSGIHDLERVLDLSDHFGVPARVIINKADINPDQAERIRDIADRRHAPVIATIPFDPAVHEALMVGLTVVEHDARSPAGRAVTEAWNSVRATLQDMH